MPRHQIETVENVRFSYQCEPIKIWSKDWVGLSVRERCEGHHAMNSVVDMLISQRNCSAIPPESFANSNLHGAIKFEVANLLEHFLLKAGPREPEISDAANVQASEHQLCKKNESS